MMKQNTLLQVIAIPYAEVRYRQNEITMLNAELAATRALADSNAKEKNEKLLAAEHSNGKICQRTKITMVDLVKLELQEASDQYTSLQVRCVDEVYYDF